MRYLVVLVICLVVGSVVEAQDFRHYYKPYTDSVNHSSLYFPLRDLMISDFEADSNRNVKTWLRDKFLNENFLKVKKSDYLLTLDPLFDNYLSKEFVSGRNLYGNSRGIRIQGILLLGDKKEKSSSNNWKVDQPLYKKLEFSTIYHETQSLFAPYLDSIIKDIRVVPGQMVYRSYGKTWDHSLSKGWLRYTPNKFFSFEVGHGKNFFGNGYRSLFLSDVAPNYPYVRIDSRFWRIHYVNLWGEFQDTNYWNEYGQPYQKKYAAMHYLSLAVTDNLEVSIFEAINWQGIDDSHTRNFELNYLNPVIFLRPVEWTVGSPDNAIFGAGLSYRIPRYGILYGQFVIDEFDIEKIIKWKEGSAANKIGGQIGYKIEDLKLNVGGNGISTFIQSELNAVRPYTYSHISSKSNYAHFNQSLAHPLQANFIEWVNFLRLRVDRFFIEGRYSWAMFGADINGSNYGHDISLSRYDQTTENGVFIGNGIRNTLTYSGLTASYLLNPYSNFNLFVSILNRKQASEIQTTNDLIFQIGFRSSVRNIYYDF